ncbi:hypothetical protein V2W30_38765 [Streptomyces sp. Q6]|uniref:Uncharacterized protein n=1 Tax=Streptomyces citrinus TaxID=3118173 RepID=A0ACD5ANB2_9ACTN
MTHATHEFTRHTDVRAALADPALVPEPPAADDGPVGASVAWLRATAARSGSGEPHQRRSALVEAELAGLDPAALWRAATVPGEGSPGCERSMSSPRPWSCRSPERSRRP